MSILFFTSASVLAVGCNGSGGGAVETFIGAAPTTGTTSVVSSSASNRPILLNASAFTFPITSVGATNAVTVTLVNGGTDIAKVSAITRAATAGTVAPFTISADTCSNAALTVGQACAFTVTFAPAAAGTSTGNFTVPYACVTSGSYSLQIPYSGFSLLPVAAIVASPTVWDFGPVAAGSSASKTFIVSNSTVGTATLAAATIGGSGLSITSDTCSGLTTLVSGGATCTVTVKYQPALSGSVIGALSLNFTDAAASTRAQNITLTGIGLVAQPTLTLSPSPYNFLTVATNSSATQAITVSNASTATATVGTVSVSGSGFTIVSQNCSSQVLVPGASCQVFVKFTPAGLGVVSGALTTPYTAPDGSAYSPTVTLGGTGTTPTTAFAFSGFSGVVGTDTTSLTSSGVTLRWTAQTAASYYVVTQTGGSSGTVLSANLFPTSVYTYNVTGLVPGTTYQFKVNAFNASGVSDGNANLVTVTTPSLTGATFGGWSDVVGLGSVFTNISSVDNTLVNTGSNRMDRNLAVVMGFGSSNIDLATGNITVTANTYVTGQKVTFRTDGTAPSGLTNSSNYYIVSVNSTTVALASSAVNAALGTKIVPADAGSGNMTLSPKGVVKLGWDLFTFSPGGSAASYNIYRSLSASSGFSVIGTSTSNTYFDYEVTDSTTYYYQVQPVVGGTEVVAAVANDSVIQVPVPPQNMALAHRWMTNREACTTLLGFTYPAGVNRNDNYSCAYTWGVGYAPHVASAQKSKWDIGYSSVVDRWQTGCNFTSMGSGAPSGGTTNQVYYQTGTGVCYIKDPTNGWQPETGNLVSLASRALMRTNQVGYSPSPATQTQGYNTCQQRSPTGVVDGNGNSTLRLMRLNEAILFRAAEGVNVNNRAGSTLGVVFGGSNLPVNGSCNISISGATRNGVSIPNAATYANFNNLLMNGSYFTRNCYSRYEVADLWSSTNEWTTAQLYNPSAGNGYFVQSSLDAGDNMIENFKLDGVMGPSVYGNTSNLFGYYYSSRVMLPLFGIVGVSASTSLGTMSVNLASTDYAGGTEGAAYPQGSQGVMLGGPNYYVYTGSRYSLTLGNLTDSTVTTGNSMSTFRCAGQVSP